MKLTTIGKVLFAAGALGAGIYWAYQHGQNNDRHVTTATPHSSHCENMRGPGDADQGAASPLRVCMSRGRDKQMQVFTFSAASGDVYKRQGENPGVGEINHIGHVQLLDTGMPRLKNWIRRCRQRH